MKITAKVSFAGLNFSAITGQVLDLPDKVAKDLIGAGYAEQMNALQNAEAKDEDKRNNAGSDTKSAPRKRNSSK
ncbi:MAG: hypothetical protein J6Y57_01105 [Lachnospiraceae bacterium]|nr:hypothetical protein [Lachnospiraceae bacterium]